jgi:Hydrolase of X-linked nucleoside diphosphate N terminal
MMTIDTSRCPTDPQWLLWAREMQALAQTGLAFTRDQFDRQRYERLLTLAAQIMAEDIGMGPPDIELMAVPKLPTIDPARRAGQS